MKGTVNWFSNSKGFGFITPEGGSKDVFVHYTAIQEDGYKSLNEGDEVQFEIVTGQKGPQADEVRVVNRAPKEPNSRNASQKVNSGD